MDKQKIIDYIRQRGDEQRVTDAEENLPDEVDLHRDEVLLARLGVHPDDLDDVPEGAADRARPQPDMGEEQQQS